MNRSTIIYGLIDPRNAELRYIGKTKCGVSSRMSGHKSNAYRRPGRRNNWLLSIYKEGLEPIVIEIEEISPDDDWEEAEIHYIAYFRWLGARLLNVSPGGIDIVFTLAARLNMSVAQRKFHKARLGIQNYSEELMYTVHSLCQMGMYSRTGVARLLKLGFKDVKYMLKGSYCPDGYDKVATSSTLKLTDEQVISICDFHLIDKDDEKTIVFMLDVVKANYEVYLAGNLCGYLLHD